ncbi:HNH endonuclease [Terrabacter carboxydivorans]|uniref:HNH endonuclease n=1 Tax=Terrabacter carboxydivorans TaxID=619730 RepID=UPI0031DB95BA
MPTTEALEALVSALSRVGAVEGGAGVGGAGVDGAGGEQLSADQELSDQARVDQLAVLERVKSAVAAAQVRVTAAFVDSQEQVAQAWSQRARECSDAGDFDGWRAARDQARAATFDEGDVRGTPARGSGEGTGDTRSESRGDRRSEGRSQDRGDGRGESRGDSQRSGGGEAGAGSRRRRRRPSGMAGVAAQVALARHESPVRGAGHVRLALALTRDMPRTLAALETGQLSEWRVQIIVRETAVLTPADRRLVDAEINTDPSQPVAGLGDRDLARRVRAVTYRIDAASVMARAAKAETDRRVTLRPAPDTMAYVTALLPVAQAVAAHAALTVAADTARAAGDERGKGQVMADTLVTPLTGQAAPDGVPVEIQLVMTDRALLAGDDTPAQLTGYGPVPAAWVRDLLTRLQLATASAIGSATGSGTGSVPQDGVEASGARAAGVWLRRLFIQPATGALVAMDSTRRTFDGGLRRYLLTRDAATCRTPWCDAPARHLDHIRDHAAGGPTTDTNGQALCVRCNHTKQLPGFTATTATAGQPGTPHTVRTTTPTGHTYTSQAPPLLPGLPPGPRPGLSLEQPPEPGEPDMLSPFEHALTLALAA